MRGVEPLRPSGSLRHRHLHTLQPVSQPVKRRQERGPGAAVVGGKIGTEAPLKCPQFVRAAS